AGGKSGQAALKPGASAQSELVRRITTSDPDDQMPQKGARLTPEEIERIRKWIDTGASWPERDDYWAFQPPKKPIPPAVKNLTSIRNPIDRFINAKLAAAGIARASEADTRTLLRRVYADLLGVPPTPDEADRFLRDK